MVVFLYHLFIFHISFSIFTCQLLFPAAAQVLANNVMKFYNPPISCHSTDSYPIFRYHGDFLWRILFEFGEHIICDFSLFKRTILKNKNSIFFFLDWFHFLHLKKSRKNPTATLIKLEVFYLPPTTLFNFSITFHFKKGS